MSVAVLNVRVGLEHEPLRPVPPFFVLLREHDLQNASHRLVMPESEQKFDRPLAYVARAPCTARILLKSVRHAQMNDRIVSEPWKHDIHSSHIPALSLDPNVAGEARPEP